MKQVCQHLKQKVLVVLDSEYGNGSWVNQTAEIEASKLITIRSNYCLWSKPLTYSGKGRPRKHGQKFKINDSTTWWQANHTVEVDDLQLGKLKIQKWDNLHFRTSPSTQMSLIKVEKLTSNSKNRKSRPLWLVWVGEQFLALEKVWQEYLRRFRVDHWYRFAKQRLHWTLPSFSTPQQSQRWSELMPLMTWQIWLAKDLVEEHHLPWQSRLKNLTPGRVAQSMFPLLVEIGSPTTVPKTRGKSSGWKKGQKRLSRKTYPIAKKGQSCRQKLPNKTA